MNYQKELNEFEIGISELLKKILPQIQAKSVGPDFVLDDAKKEFEKLFLNTANHRLTDAYQSYVFGARTEREQNRMTQTKMIKAEEIIEIEDDPDESEIENESLVQSTTGDWEECKASDSNNNADKNTTIGHVNEPYVKQIELESQKPTTTLLMTTTTVIQPIRPIQSQPSFDTLKFQCNYCSISHDDIDGIYKHWTYTRTGHADAYKAFQFHIEMIGACFICNKNGTFKELKQHFKDDHAGLDFGAVNISDKTKCLICCFSGKNMSEHFRTNHAMTMDSLSPIRVHADILDALKAVRVQKKFKCYCCDNVVYNTKNQIIEHYRCYPMNHDIKRSPFIEIVDEQPILVTCGICQKTCDQTEMLDHMQNHQIKCSTCAVFDGKINELSSHYHQKHPGTSMKEEKLKFGIAYLQTKLVHCNGLTLTYANVLGAKDDENEKIQSFFIEKSSLRSPPDQPNNHDPAVLDCNSPVLSLDDSAFVSPRSTGSKSDSNDLLREDLLQQRTYLNTLVILGLPAAYMNNDNNLLTMFGSLCLHLQVPIEKSEIKSIYSLKNELIVKLRTRSKKEKIIEAMVSKYHWPCQLKSDTLVKIPPNEVPRTVYVNPKLTSHFHRMWMKAKRFRNQRKIHSFRLSTGGIAMRINKGDEEVFARSFDDMENCVNGTSKPMPPNPKRMKSN